MIFEDLKILDVEYKPTITEIKFRSSDTALHLATKNVKVAESLINLLQDNECVVDIRLPSESKEVTKDSRSYVFGLMRQIGRKTRQNEREVYEQMLRQTQMGDPITIAKKLNGKSWREVLGKQGIKHYDIIKDDGKFIAVRCYAGISLMDQTDLNIFIDKVKSQAEELDIDTSTPSEKGLYG